MQRPHHTQEERSRSWFTYLLVLTSIAGVAIPIMLLLEPTRDHVIMAIVAVILAIIGVIVGIRVVKKLPEVYRMPSDTDTGSGTGGDPDPKP